MTMTNSPELQKEIDEWREKHKNAVNGHWIKFIKERNKNNLNTQVLMIGMTGTGKSLHNLSSCLMVNPHFCVDYITFSPIETLTLINSGKLKAGDCVVMEEAGVQINSAAWQSQESRLFSQFFETIRRLRINFFLNCPNRSNIAKTIRNLMHVEATPIYINRKSKTCVCKAYLLQPSSKKPEPYYHTLTKKGTEQPIKIWTAPLPPEGFVKAYEKKRDEYQRMINLKTLNELKVLNGEGDERKRLAKCEACGKYFKTRSITVDDVPSGCSKCRSKRTIWVDEERAVENAV